MELSTLTLILVALGSLSLLVLRDPRAVLVGLGVQWFGLITSLMPANIVAGGNPVGAVAIEAVTAVVCLAVLAITVRNLQALKLSRLPDLPDERRLILQRAESAAHYAPPPWSREGVVGDAWLWAVGLLVGVAGYGLARIYPLGGPQTGESGILAFYWTLLASIMTLVVHGTRDAVKMAAALLALLNAAALALYLLSLTSPGSVSLGLMAAVRVGMCVVLAYSWLLLKVAFLSPNLDLGRLFDGRDGRWATETALAVSEQPSAAGDDHEVTSGAQAAPSEGTNAGG